jgi:hypothetical protein
MLINYFYMQMSRLTFDVFNLPTLLEKGNCLDSGQDEWVNMLEFPVLIPKSLL